MSRTVLIADDESNLLNLLKDNLEDEGFTVFTASDGPAVTVKGILQFNADPDVKKDGLNRYVEVTDQSRNTGLPESLKSMLTTVGGQTPYRKFKEEKGVVEVILRCHMQLKRMPHTGMPGSEDILTWYKANLATVVNALENETNHPAERSQAEDQYGIDITNIELSTVAFPPEIEDALDEEEEAKLRAKAAAPYVAVGKQLSAEFPGLDDSQRFAGSQSIVMGVKPEMVTVQGGAPIVLTKEMGGGKK